ncbi:MAG: CopD family protein [Gammaproteobacteria bacterium]|nr:CopD family protein [Gammaproteobacteria bacterium]
MSLNPNSLYILLHVVASVVWVGGMVFAHKCLRPVAADLLEPPQRLTLWVGVFANFFPLVWISVVLLLSTGFTMVYSIWGGMAEAPLHIHIMAGFGILMMLVFMYVFFSPYKKLKAAVLAQQWPAGAEALAKIRQLVGFNILVGLFVLVVASAGRYLI